jgi:hypothetical protein
MGTLLILIDDGSNRVAHAVRNNRPHSAEQCAAIAAASSTPEHPVRVVWVEGDLASPYPEQDVYEGGAITTPPGAAEALATKHAQQRADAERSRLARFAADARAVGLVVARE